MWKRIFSQENVQLIKLCSKSCDVSGELISEFWFLPKMMVHVMAKYNFHLSKEHSIQFILIYIEPAPNSNHLEELYIVRQRPYNNAGKTENPNNQWEGGKKGNYSLLTSRKLQQNQAQNKNYFFPLFLKYTFSTTSSTPFCKTLASVYFTYMPMEVYSNHQSLILGHWLLREDNGHPVEERKKL